MAEISVQSLQDLAVKCVGDFLNTNTPLNNLLAKEASERGLNSDQLQRAVECVNTLAFLKSAEVSGDKTIEFPVADYKEVIKLASLPESLLNPATHSPVSELDSFLQEKSASVKEADVEAALAYTRPELGQDQALLQLQKQAQINLRRLEDARGSAQVLASNLVKAAAEFKANPQALEILSASSLDDAGFKKIACLVFGEVKQRLDYAGFLTKSASVNPAESLAGMLKEAQDLVQEIATREDWAQRAETVQEELIKQAFLGTLAKGLGYGAAKTVMAPIKVVGKGLGMAGAGLANAAGRGINNVAAKTTLGSKLGLSIKNPSRAAKIGLGASAVVGGAAFDAMSFKPKVDPANDRSGSAWEALQGQ